MRAAVSGLVALAFASIQAHAATCVPKLPCTSAHWVERDGKTLDIWDDKDQLLAKIVMGCSVDPNDRTAIASLAPAYDKICEGEKVGGRPDMMPAALRECRIERIVLPPFSATQVPPPPPVKMWHQRFIDGCPPAKR